MKNKHLEQLAAADPVRTAGIDGLPSNGFFEEVFSNITEGRGTRSIVALEDQAEWTGASARSHRWKGITMNRAQLAVVAVVGISGLSLAGVAIADAVSPSPLRAFIVQSRLQPRLTSTAMLDRGGRHDVLSRQTGRVAQMHALATTASTTLADGTVLSAPPADANAAVSQEQAWNAFVAYGTPPNIYVLSSTPAPTIQLAQLSKTNAPNGGSLVDEVVWVIQYEDISLYTPIPTLAGGPSPSANPADRTGYLDVFVDATTGHVLYTVAHDTN